MGQHSFHFTLSFRYFPDLDAGLRRHPLIGASFQEFAHPETAGVTGRPARGQYVIGPDRFIPIGDGCFFSDEEGTVVP